MLIIFAPNLQKVKVISLPPPEGYILAAVCLSVGLSVCLFVSRITQKLLGRFR